MVNRLFWDKDAQRPGRTLYLVCPARLFSDRLAFELVDPQRSARTHVGRQLGPKRTKRQKKGRFSLLELGRASSLVFTPRSSCSDTPSVHPKGVLYLAESLSWPTSASKMAEAKARRQSLFCLLRTIDSVSLQNPNTLMNTIQSERPRQSVLDEQKLTENHGLTCDTLSSHFKRIVFLS